MLNFLVHSVEYQNLGLNYLTAGAFGALMITLVQSWGLQKQITRIWKAKRAGVLSVHWFGYLVGFMLASIPYGVGADSLTIVVGVTILLYFHLCILWGIFKFRGFTLGEVVGLALYACMLPAMILFPWKDLIYLMIALGTVGAMAMQLLNMFVAKANGEVEIHMLVTILVNVSFWAIYAFAIEALGLMILNPMLFVITIFTILVWLENDKPRVKPSS